MTNDLELVKSLKNGTKSDIFFKEKIILELKKNNYSYDQTTVDEILKEGLDTYKEDTKMPFLFHIKNIIKNNFNKKYDINTGIFSKFEYKVLSLYLNKYNNVFLSKEDIAKDVSYPRSFIEEVITKFENMDKTSIEEVFPDYEKKLEERKKYFYHPPKTLTEDDIELIGYYIGGIGNKPLNIYELILKYDISSNEIRKKLIGALNLLKKEDNLETVIKRFKGKEKILYRKAKDLGIRINNTYKEPNLEKTRIKLSKKEKEILKQLNLYHDKLITKEKMAKLLEQKDYKSFRKCMTKLRNKITNYPALEDEVLKIYPLFRKDKKEYCELLSDNEIKILTMLNEEQDNIDEKKITETLGFKTVQSYRTVRYKLFDKINSNEELKLHILKFFPTLKFDTIYLTDNNKAIIQLLEEYKDNPLSNDEIAKKLGYKNADSYGGDKFKLFKKLKKYEELYKKALEICPSLSLEKNAYRKKKYSLSNKEKEILRLLEEYKDNPLSNDEMAKRLDFKNANSYIRTRIYMLIKLRENEELCKDAFEICPSLNIERNAYRKKKYSLSNKEKEILRLLEEYKDNPLSNDEMAKRLGYKNANSYIRTRIYMLIKLRKNEELCKDAFEICPSLNLEKNAYRKKKYNKIPSLSNKEKEILRLLEEYKDNPLSNDEMAKRLGYKNANSYIRTRIYMLIKLRKNEELCKDAFEICPSLNLEKNAYRKKKYNKIPSLSNKEKEILRLLEVYKDNPLSNDEMATELGYKNANSYIKTRTYMFKKLRENEELCKEIASKYPFIFYEINIRNIRFTVKDIDFLKKYTLVKNNNLIYSSIKEIATYFSKTKNTIYYHIDILKNKVISNLEDNIDLNTVLWPNFIEAFIARNNFSVKNSVKVKEKDLHNINDNNTKEKLLLGVKMLEESIFNEYVEHCDLKDKLILAFRLGYFDKRFFTSSEVADILDTDESHVIELTKDCLYNSREAFIKTKVKKK